MRDGSVYETFLTCYLSLLCFLLFYTPPSFTRLLSSFIVGKTKLQETHLLFGALVLPIIKKIEFSENPLAHHPHRGDGAEIPALNLTFLEERSLARSRRIASERHCWIRWRRTVEPSDLSKVMTKEATDRTKSSHALLNDQLSQIKTSESEFSVVATDEGDEPGNQTSKSTANGSIITMTMKNNHLIVETEERLEGIVSTVEVGEVALEPVPVAEGSTAIVHAVNNPYKPEFEFSGVNTGLSTSDLSSSSEASMNRGYRYGTQEEYRGEDEYIDRQIKEIGNRRDLRPSLDLEPRQLGLENPAFLPTPTLAEAS